VISNVPEIVVDDTSVNVTVALPGEEGSTRLSPALPGSFANNTLVTPFVSV